jgi:hypothetical protein
MKRYSKQVRQHTGTMETETIQKNGARPKSHTSRGNAVIAVTLICMALILAALPAAAQKPDVALAGLRGKVKSVKTCTYSATERFGEIAKGAPVEECFEWYYNEQGYKTESRNDCDWLSGLTVGKYHAKVIYKYNASGHLAEAFYYDKDGKLSSKIVYKRVVTDYGAVAIFLTDADDEDISYVPYYLYNVNGNLIEESSINGTYRKSHYYDENGRCVETLFYDFWENQKYDVVSHSEEYEYNDKNDCVRQSTSQFQNYDEWSEESAPEETAVITMTIDSIRYAITKSDITYYSYVYDAHGNWMQRTEMQGEAKKPHIIVERTIEYY